MTDLTCTAIADPSAVDEAAGTLEERSAVEVTVNELMQVAAQAFVMDGSWNARSG